MNFNASVFMSEQLNNLMVKAGQDLAQRAVTACAEHYKFDAEEAIRLLSLENVKVERKESGKSKKNDILVKKIAVVKAAFPLPFNGEFKDACCYALRQNNGLYTQCQVSRKGENSFCKQCQVLADKGVDGIPEYGTIQQRMASGIFEYVDPKGRKPVSYTKVMKKYKLTQEQVEEEASKLNITVDQGHFVAPEADAKRGRPSSQKEKVPKEEKQAKGRPKKAKKVLQIDGDDDEDLFAALVADANNAVEEDKPEVLKKKAGKSDEEKEAERLAKETEKQEKEVKRLAEKQEKEAKLAAEKAEKAAKLASEKAEKEAKLALAKAEKEAKLAADKAEKEAKLALAKAEKEAKLAAKTSKSTKKAAEEEEEADVVKKIDFEGKKYLKSKKTNIVYDYIEYTKNQEQVVLGKWNETTNKIDFSNTDEEEEEEYDA
jgi:chemotaxis protein histidine kinase CheA